MNTRNQFSKEKIEDHLKNLLSDSLKVPIEDIHRPFVEIAASSMAMVDALRQISDSFGVKPSLRKIFEQCGNIDKLSDYILELIQSPIEKELNSATKSEALPFTPLQNQLAFLSSLGTDASISLNESVVISLQGYLNIDALEKAVKTLISKHDSLRIRLDLSQKTFHIIEDDGFKIQYEELKLGSASTKELIKNYLLDNEKYQFNLDNTQLFQIKLLKIQQNTHILSILVHSIISDYQSLLNLVIDLSSLYNNFNTNYDCDASELVKTTDSFANFYSISNSKDTSYDKAWWLNKFSDGVPVLNLQTDYLRPAVKSYRGSRLVIPLGDEFSPLKQEGFSSKNSTAISIHLMANLALFCSRVTNQTEIVIGTFARSIENNAFNLVANITNSLPLLLKLDMESSFKDLIKNTQATLLDSIDHSSFPFASLVSSLNPTRDRSRSPIFTVAFDRQNLPNINSFDDLKATFIIPPSMHSRYDIKLTLVELADIDNNVSYQINCDYSDEIFSAKTIANLMKSYLSLAKDSLENPSKPLFEISILDNDSVSQILSSWNNTKTDFLNSNMSLSFAEIRQLLSSKTLHDGVSKKAKEVPEDIAVWHKDGSISYFELDTRSNQLANRLRQMGISSEDRVGVIMHRTPEIVVALLGVLKAGAVYVPMDPAYPLARNNYILEDALVKVIIRSESVPSLTNSLITSKAIDEIILDKTYREINSFATNLIDIETRENQLAYIIYTSGSTGNPKGVAIEHKSAVNLVHWAITTFSKQDFSSTLASTSICFDLSVFEIFATLHSGGSIKLVSNVLELSESTAFDTITLINTVPSAMQTILANKSGLPQSLRVVNLAGEPLRKDLANKIFECNENIRVFNLYGPSEGTTYSTYIEIKKDDLKEPSIGYPIANNRIYILDKNKNILPQGFEGEMWVAGTGVARGYFQKEDLTKERFFKDPYMLGDMMYKTGDLGRYRPDGQIDFLGRIDHQVKIHGFRIELGEIESVLSQHNLISDVIVTINEDSNKDKKLLAYVETKRTEAVLGIDLKAYLKELLPSFMIPSTFIELEAFPRLPNGKVDRKELYKHSLKANDNNSRTGRDFIAPATPLERTLAGIFAKTLGVSEISTSDDFFSLGGHSLLMTPLVLEINSQLGVRLTLSEFFTATTVASMAKLLEPKIAVAPIPKIMRRTGPEVKDLFDNLRKDALLAPDIKPASPFIETPIRRIFFTGATGFVGAHLLHELLKITDAHIECLIRANNYNDGLERLRKGLSSYGLWDSSFISRIGIICGDLSKKGLGIEQDKRKELAQKTDSIFHVGAMVNFLYPYSTLKQSNVEGTREVIKFAFEERVKPVHFVSSTAIWPMGRTGRFNENTNIDHDTRLNLGYDESKWCAERMLMNARDRGLPVNIYRPGEVSGHSKSGICILDHFMFSLLKGSLQIKVFPEVKCHVDMAPVDYVAQSIAYIATKKGATNDNFHVIHPNPCSADDFYTFNRERGYSFEVFTMDDWRKHLFSHRELNKNALYPFLPLLEEFQEENLQLPIFDMTNIKKALEGSNVKCPLVYPSLLNSYYDFFIKVGFLHKP